MHAGPRAAYVIMACGFVMAVAGNLVVFGIAAAVAVVAAVVMVRAQRRTHDRYHGLELREGWENDRRGR